MIAAETWEVNGGQEILSESEESAALMNGRELADRIERMKERMAAQEPTGELSWSEFSRRAGLARQHALLMVTRLRKGRDVEMGSLMAIASLGGVSLDYLVYGRDAGGVLLREQPGFADAVAAAAQRYPSVPDFALAYVGGFRLPNAPARVDASFVKELAAAWHDAASPEERSAAQMAYVRR